MAKITAFGLGGSGTSTLAKAFADIYGFECKSSGDIFREMAKENGMSVSEFARFCKRRPEYDRKIDETTVEYGRTHEDFIFESRLAWHFIPDSFKVKLDCDLNTRVGRIHEREGGDYWDVFQQTAEREDSDMLRYRNLYGIENYTSNSHFDLILDSRSNSPEELARLIYEHIEAPIVGQSR